MEDLAKVRESLIYQGYPVEDLDDVKEPRLLKDIGEGLTLSLINDEQIGNLVIELLMQVAMLEARISNLEGGK